MKKKKKRKKIKNKRKKHLKIRYDRIFLCLLILFLIVYVIWFILNKPITNIMVTGNEVLSDQVIIDAAGLRNYPSTLNFSTMAISKKIEKEELIKDAKVTRVGLRKIKIKVTENKPIFYDNYNSKTVLEDGDKVSKKYDVPILINYTPSKTYKELVLALNEVNEDVLMRISTIKYDPNEVDAGRFLVSMNDGNYVYLSINKFTHINNYIKIMKKFQNKKGILYLDSGEYFKVMEG